MGIKLNKMTIFHLFVMLIVFTKIEGIIQPKILTRPRSITKAFEEDVTFRCKVLDLNNYHVDWYFPKENMMISQDEEIKASPAYKYRITVEHDEGVVSYDLTVKNLQLHDAGNYQCILDAGGVPDPSLAIHHHLDIEDLVDDNASPDSGTLDITDCCSHSNVDEGCLPICGTGRNNPDVQIDVMKACKRQLPKLAMCGNAGRNHVECCLNSLVPLQCLSYCSASLSGNHSCSEFALPIVNCFNDGLALPSPPLQVFVNVISETKLLIKWQKPSAMSRSRIRYKVFYRKETEDHFLSTRHLELLEFTLTNLVPETKYIMYVISINDYGTSIPSIFQEAYTESASNVLGSEVYNLTDCCIRRSVRQSCLFLCQPFTVAQREKRMVQCLAELPNVFLCISGERDHWSCCHRSDVPAMCKPVCSGTGLLQSQASNLLPCFEQFTGKINSCFMEGIGKIPGPPQNVRSAEVSMTGATIIWDPPIDLPMNVVAYIVRWGFSGQSSPQHHSVNEVSTTEVYLENLFPGTRYFVEVSSKGSEGMSIPSTRLLLLTRLPAESVVIGPVHREVRKSFVGCCEDLKVTPKCRKYCTRSIKLSRQNFWDVECSKEFARILFCGIDQRDLTTCCKKELSDDSCVGYCKITESEMKAFKPNARSYSCSSEFFDMFQCLLRGKVLVPSPPLQLTVHRVSIHSITLTWHVPTETPEDDQISYIVEYREGNDWKQTEVRAFTNNFVLQNLKDDTEYSIRVVAVSKEGRSIPTESLKQRTDKDNSGLVPTSNYTAHRNYSDCCLKNGISPECTYVCAGEEVLDLSACGGEIGVIVTCAADARDHSMCCQRRAVPNVCTALCRGDAASIGVQSAFCLAYVPQILACFHDGSELLPGPPEDFHLSGETANSLVVSWGAPGSDGKSIKYNCFIREEDLPETVQYRIYEDVRSPFRVRDLKPVTPYMIYVVSVMKSGASQPSAIITAFTTSNEKPPVFVRYSPEEEVTTKSVISLICQTNDRTKIKSVVWWHRSQKYQPSKSWKLTLANVEKKDSGRWTCILTTQDNRRASASLILKVTFALNITVPLSKFVIRDERTTSVSISCLVFGNPSSHGWQFEGKSLRTVWGEQLMTSEFDEGTGEVRMMLTLYQISQERLGSYMCTAINQYGNKSETVELIGPPTGLKPRPSPGDVGECCISKKVQLDCRSACSFQTDIKNLPVINEAKCLSDIPKMIECAADGRDHSDCCAQKNIPSFCLPFCAGNANLNLESFGCLEYLEDALSCMKNGRMIIPGPPTNLKATVTHEGYISVQWEAPDSLAYLVRSYVVLYRTVSGTGSAAKPFSNITVQGGRLRARIDKVIAFSHYEISVTSANDFGMSKSTDIARVTTQEFFPSKPRYLSKVQLNSDGKHILKLTWTRPKIHSGAVLAYVVHYREVQSKLSWKKVETPSPILFVDEKFFGYNSDFVFYVTAKSSHYESEKSNMITANISGAKAKSSGTARKIGLAFGCILLAIFVVVVAVLLGYACNNRSKQSQREAMAASSAKDTDMVSFENPRFSNLSRLEEREEDNDGYDQGPVTFSTPPSEVPAPEGVDDVSGNVRDIDLAVGEIEPAEGRPRPDAEA